MILRQASRIVLVPVRLVMPQLTIARTLSARGRKASTAAGSCTITTVAVLLLENEGVESSAASMRTVESSKRRRMKRLRRRLRLRLRGDCGQMAQSLSPFGEFIALTLKLGAFLDTYGTQCYTGADADHQNEKTDSDIETRRHGSIGTLRRTFLICRMYGQRAA